MTEHTYRVDIQLKQNNILLFGLNHTEGEREKYAIDAVFVQVLLQKSQANFVWWISSTVAAP